MIALAEVLTGYGIMYQLNSFQPFVVLDKACFRAIMKMRLCNEGGDVGGNDPPGRDSVRRWCSGVYNQKKSIIVFTQKLFGVKT